MDHQDECTWWEIPDDKLKVYANTVLGSGQFGVILLGDVTKNHKETKCAIKTLKCKKDLPVVFCECIVRSHNRPNKI